MKFALLIGSDDARQLAFDVWEPTTPAEAKALSNDEHHSGARSVLPSWLAESFNPQAPGRSIHKLRTRSVSVTVKKDRASLYPIYDLDVYCWKEVGNPWRQRLDDDSAQETPR